MSSLPTRSWQTYNTSIHTLNQSSEWESVWRSLISFLKSFSVLILPPSHTHTCTHSHWLIALTIEFNVKREEKSVCVCVEGNDPHRASTTYIKQGSKCIFFKKVNLPCWPFVVIYTVLLVFYPSLICLCKWEMWKYSERKIEPFPNWLGICGQAGSDEVFKCEIFQSPVLSFIATTLSLAPAWWIFTHDKECSH